MFEFEKKIYYLKYRYLAKLNYFYYKIMNFTIRIYICANRYAMTIKFHCDYNIYEYYYQIHKINKLLVSLISLYLYLSRIRVKYYNVIKYYN